jgi:GntR family transcriptional regulator/MocR family aminotransferase
VNGLAQYRIDPSGPGALIFGFATLSDASIAEGVAILADVIRDLRSG